MFLRPCRCRPSRPSQSKGEPNPRRNVGRMVNRSDGAPGLSRNCCPPVNSWAEDDAAGDTSTASDAAATSNTDFMPLLLFELSVSDMAQTRQRARCCIQGSPKSLSRTDFELSFFYRNLSGNL